MNAADQTHVFEIGIKNSCKHRIAGIVGRAGTVVRQKEIDPLVVADTGGGEIDIFVTWSNYPAAMVLVLVSRISRLKLLMRMHVFE